MDIIGKATICGIDVNFNLVDNVVVFNCNHQDLEKITTVKKDDDGKLFFDGSEHIKEVFISGRTSNKEYIFFYVALSSVDCFRAEVICELYSYYISKEDVAFNTITIYGGDISIVVSSYNSHKIDSNCDKITICLNNKNIIMHSVTFNDGTNAQFSCFESCLIKNRDKNPIEYVGIFQFVITPTKDIKMIFDYVELVRNFIGYLCFRTDIGFDKVILGLTNKKAQKETKCGEYYICNNPEANSVESIKNKRFIPFSQIEEKSSYIIRMIKGNNIFMHHLREGHKRAHFISGGDVVTLTAGFEYEFDAAGIKIDPKKSEKEQKTYIISRYNSILKSKKT